MSLTLFRIICILGGSFIVMTGLNNALGGFNTMGWTGIGDFFRVTDQHQYEIQDNHIRFIGAIWAGMGLVMWISAHNPLKYQQGLLIVFTLIFLAGIARFTSGNLELLFSPALIGSLIAELVGMPILAMWLLHLSTSRRDS